MEQRESRAMPINGSFVRGEIFVFPGCGESLMKKVKP